jgi:hypothetical protein
VFDRAAIDLAGVEALRVPSAATIEAGGEPGLAVVVLQRARFYSGSNREALVPEEFAARLRRDLGLVTKRDGATLWLATFGEWDSHIDGGDAITMRIVVPEGLQVMREPRLARELSEGHDRRTRRPAPGWTVLETAPDPAMAGATDAAPAATAPPGGGGAGAGRGRRRPRPRRTPG